MMDLQIPTSQPVMLTGATGFIGGVLCVELLKAGLTVHCAVRSPDNEAKIKHLVDAAATTKGKLKFFKAELLDKGSYLESMKGCSVVFHTASPFSMNVKDATKDLLEPAVEGTRNVLTSAEQTDSVKRVVLTSSMYAIADTPKQTLAVPVCDESVWNTETSKKVNPYAYSKLLAEKEAWKMADAQKQYKLVVINPSWVHGPAIKPSLSSESTTFIKTVGDGTMASGVPNLGIFVVDVRDVATAHVRAGFLETASGRYIINGHNIFVPEWIASLKERFGAYPLPGRVLPWPLLWLLGPLVGLDRRLILKSCNIMPKVNNAKSVRELQMTYRPQEDTIVDAFAQLVEHDLIPDPKNKSSKNQK